MKNPLPYRNIEFAGRDLINQVCKIPPDAARAVAALFESVAAELKLIDQKYRYQQEIKQDTQKKLFKLHQIPVKLHECINSGMSFKDALNHLRSSTGAPSATIYHYWLSHIKKLEQEAFKVRNEKILELYKNGKTDAEISALVELSPRQVQRIIRQNR